LLRALSERKREGRLSQQALARKLDVHRSLINRQLSGEANLTLRSLADLAWAMDMEIWFELKKPAAHPGQNEPVITSTLGYGEIKYVNASVRRNRVTKGAPSQANSGEIMKSIE
jgi:transcriptional regulator with XRE-family HTH domain